MGDPQQPDRHDARGLQTHHEPFRLENSMDTGRLLSARLRLLQQFQERCLSNATLIKRAYCYGLGLYAFGTFLFYPAMLCSSVNIDFSFIMFLLAIFVLFSGLSVLETSANSYVLMMGDEQTATQRLNFAQSFNPFGAITGVVISQVFILSQLNLLTSSERAALPMDELTAIQGAELNAVTTTYVILGLVMLAIMLAIRLTRMPSLKEAEEKVDFGGTFRRLVKNKNYVWGIVAQFFYVGAQIAVWSFVIRYAMQQLHFDTGRGHRSQAMLRQQASFRPFATWNPSQESSTTSANG